MADSFRPSDLCEDLICCSICFEPYSDARVPKALPCLHTFCVLCLKGSIKVHRQNVQRNFRSRMQVSDFPCPVCKDVTKIPMNGLKGFKDDFRIRRISALLQRKNSEDQLLAGGSDSDEASTKEKNKKLCDVCKFLEKEIEAPKYCVECRKLLCEECASKHRDTSVSSQHRVISSSKTVPKQQTCKKHHPEPLNIYCKSCEDAVCMTCTMTSEHEGHELVKAEEECGAIKTELVDLLNACKERVPEIQSKLTCFNDMEKNVKRTAKNVQKNLRSKFIKNICKMQVEQNEVERDLEKLCKEKYTELESGSGQLETHLADMESLVEMTEGVLDRGQHAQIVSMQHDVRDRLRTFVDTTLPVQPDENKILDFGTFNELLEVTHEADEITENLDLSGSQTSILTEIRDVMAEMRSLSTRTMAADPQLVASLGVKGSEVGQFNFPSSVAVLGNGDVIVADLHNDRVQIFDKNGKFKSTFGKDGFHPCGAAITKDGNIAVTDCKQNVNCVKVFTPGGALVSTLGAGEFSYPFSIAIDSKNHFIVTDPSMNKVIVLNEDGTVLTKFNTRSRFCFYLTVNQKDEVLVSDWYHHCVNVFDIQGNLLYRIGSKGYGDGQLMIPLGITIDGKGNVYVLDCKCERVSQFRPDGTFAGHFLEKAEGLVHCRALAMCPAGNLLITCGDNKRDVPNEVRIYKLTE